MHVLKHQCDVNIKKQKSSNEICVLVDFKVQKYMGLLSECWIEKLFFTWVWLNSPCSVTSLNWTAWDHQAAGITHDITIRILSITYQKLIHKSVLCVLAINELAVNNSS